MSLLPTFGGQSPQDMMLRLHAHEVFFLVSRNVGVER